MAIVTINDENLTNIASAIREKNGTQDTYKPSEMPAAISAIVSGGAEVNMVETAFTGASSGDGYTPFNVYDYVDSPDDILCLMVKTSSDYTGASNTNVYIKGYNFVLENETYSPFSSSAPATMLGIIANPALYPYDSGVNFVGRNNRYNQSPAFAIRSDGNIYPCSSYYNYSSYQFRWNYGVQGNTTVSYMHIWMLYK